MSEINKQIRSIEKKNFSPVYLVQGTEQYLSEKVRFALLNAVLVEEVSEFNFGQFDMRETTIDAALQEAESFPFFGDKRLVFVQQPYFLTGKTMANGLDHDMSYLESYLQNPSEFSILVIFAPYEKLDKRKKITKTLLKKAELINIEPMNEKGISDIVKSTSEQAGYSIDTKALEKLIQLTDRNLSKSMMELEKLMIYHQEDKQISLSSVEELVPKTLEQNIFELNDLVLSKEVQRSIELYQDLLTQKEDPIKIIALMIGQFRLLLQVKILRRKGYQQADIAKILKVHPFRVKLALQKEKKFEQSVLSKAHHQLIDADYLIKSGRVDPELQVELFIMKFADGHSQLQMK
ncbi:DNA polymerase III subunit delta [Marinilactibacillus kalidii]|uniref:DNA polymerase III subunit delta n=1 Tax=Marinilactibacillus kalidii TaxID=2820274 RepID=UPI001ABDEA95|nr:DNA polymerase III subunit delta [Marinilactibacillus kalidii]